MDTYVELGIPLRALRQHGFSNLRDRHWWRRCFVDWGFFCFLGGGCGEWILQVRFEDGDVSIIGLWLVRGCGVESCHTEALGSFFFFWWSRTAKFPSNERRPRFRQFESKTTATMASPEFLLSTGCVQMLTNWCNWIADPKKRPRKVRSPKVLMNSS